MRNDDELSNASSMETITTPMKVNDIKLFLKILEKNEMLTKLRLSSMDRMELRQVRSSGRNTRC